MNLKRLEISGFKSFANALEMDFSGGITAVLGPNGCGKTNIVDSVRWVLGEQKTRLLRNTKMENVIFNGTKIRKPLGMAAVTMTLSNEDHMLPVDRGEVTISRKLFRSGVSEYYVNGAPARLKDIKGLLIDSGLGSHTYSIIEREMVDSVISDKDNDKRFLLEEAAGVMRYRVQREEALRKIKHTETDLTRLNDILVELDKEIRSLRYQMGKARRYTRLKEKVDRLEAALIKRSLLELLEKKDAVERERSHHEGITLADENEITVLDNRLQESRIRASELERGLQDLHESRYALSRSLQQREEKIAILSERIALSTNRIAEDDDEVARSRAKRESLAKDLAVFNETIDRKERALAERRERLAGEESRLGAVSRELDALNAQLRDKKQLALDLVREKERRRGVREHLDARLREVEQRMERDKDEHGRLVEEEAAVVERVTRTEERADAERAGIARTRGAIEEAQRRSARVLDLVALCEDRHSSANIDLHRFMEKRDYLERIKSEHASNGNGMVAGRRGIKGIVADHVKVDKKYRKCFEACLAPVLQAVMSESREHAFEFIEELKGTGGARIQLLYPHGNGAPPPQVSGANIIGSALDLLGSGNGVAEYLGPFLADVAVVGNVEQAVDLLSRSPEARVATLDGVFFDGPGRIVVAAAEEIDITLLELDSKLGEVDGAIRRFGSRARMLDGRKGALSNEKNRLAADTAKLRDRLRSEEEARERILEEQRRHEIELARVREKLAALQQSLDANADEIRELRGRLDEQPAPGAEPASVEMTDEELTRLEEKAVGLQRQKEALGETAGRTRLDLATINGEISTAKEKRSNIETLDAELDELITNRFADATRCREEIAGAKREIEGSKEEIGVMHERVDAVEKEIEEAKGAHGGVKSECDDLEKQLKELKDRRDHKKENLQRCSLEIATLETRIAGLVEKARDSFHQDLEPYIADRGLFDASEWEKMDEADLEETRRKVEAFGPVNMLALEEFKERKERFDFLTAQKNDVEEARDALLQAVRRINREARRRLGETFEVVRKNFRETFQTLFDGGEADLLFTESDDPLEAKIRIVASPKGKRLHDISSLSGGERALVALSLLFAIYLVKPSPFCVFDEVDAPLDDANVARFVNMLRSFTDRTQFIVITHNKKTMEAANHLYGVTMEEPGVSKMVSVHIGDVDDFRENGGNGRRRPEEASVR